MPQQAALLLCIGLIAWLLVRDVTRRPGVSWASWLVVIWAVIVSSRPVSAWLQSGATMTPDGYLEGSPADRAVFTALILAGYFILLRRITLAEMVRQNGWVFAFYAYCLVSVMWSDYPFVAFKRWFKDFGSVVMVFVLLTERDPVDAIKAVIVRCAYVLVPLSALFIRYYPELGRFYFGWNQNEMMYVGVATHKNTLGALLLVSSIFLVWDLLGRRNVDAHKALRLGRVDSLIVLLMAAYLLMMANSATALACTVIGIGVFLGTGQGFIKRNLRFVELYIIGVVAFWFVADNLFGVTELIVLSLGRDMGLTERTNAWDFLLAQDINAWVGAGFKSFWTGDRMRRVWLEFPGIVQAHNGYVDKYLEGGALGLLFLAGMMFAGFRNIKRHLVDGEDFARVRLTFWIMVLFYNLSEAAFSAMSLLWFVTLVVTIEGSHLASPASEPLRVQLNPARATEPVPSPWRGPRPVGSVRRRRSHQSAVTGR